MHLLSLAEAVKALTGRPTGTFILRPHDAKEEEFLCFLSFVGTELEVGGVHALWELSRYILAVIRFFLRFDFYGDNYLFLYRSHFLFLPFSCCVKS